MQIDQSIIYIVILLFTILTMFVVGVTFAYLRLIKKLQDVKEGRDKYPDPKELLLRAHSKSQRIIEDATQKANQIISSSETLKTTNIDNIQKQIDKAQSENLKIYQESVGKIQDESIKVLHNVPEYIKTLLSKEILIVKDDLLREVEIAKENAKALIEEVYRKADNEVSEYKRVRMDAMDETVVAIIQQISRKVLNKEIDVAEHEKLVLKTLEEAKRQNVFSQEGEGGEKMGEKEEKKVAQELL